VLKKVKNECISNLPCVFIFNSPHQFGVFAHSAGSGSVVNRGSVRFPHFYTAAAHVNGVFKFQTLFCSEIVESCVCLQLQARALAKKHRSLFS